MHDKRLQVCGRRWIGNVIVIVIVIGNVNVNGMVNGMVVLSVIPVPRSFFHVPRATSGT